MLIRKIITKNPKAGKSSGSGNVFGAGKVDKYVNRCMNFVRGVNNHLFVLLVPGMISLPRATAARERLRKRSPRRRAE
jgi:hypothetical protein